MLDIWQFVTTYSPSPTSIARNTATKDAIRCLVLQQNLTVQMVEQTMTI